MKRLFFPMKNGMIILDLISLKAYEQFCFWLGSLFMSVCMLTFSIFIFLKLIWCLHLGFFFFVILCFWCNFISIA